VGRRSGLLTLGAAGPWMRRGGWQAALTTTGRVGTTRRLGSGKQDGKVYECRKQWSNPLKARTGSNLVDVGRTAVHARGDICPGDSEAAQGRRRVGHGEGLRRTRHDAAGESWAPHPSIGQQ
jgi:hypothetical protein